MTSTTTLSCSAIGILLIMAGTVQAAKTTQEITDELIKQIKANNITSAYQQRSFTNAAAAFINDRVLGLGGSKAVAGFLTCSKANACPVWKICARSENYNMSKCWTHDDCSNVKGTFDDFNVTKGKFLCDVIPITSVQERTDALIQWYVLKDDQPAFRAALDSFTKSAKADVNSCDAAACDSPGDICARSKNYNMSKCWIKTDCDKAFKLFSTHLGTEDKFFCGPLPARSIKEITDELVALVRTEMKSTFLDAAGMFVRGARVGLNTCQSADCKEIEVCGRSSNYDMSRCMKKDDCEGIRLNVFNEIKVTKGKFFCGAGPTSSASSLMANAFVLLMMVACTLFHACSAL